MADGGHRAAPSKLSQALWCTFYASGVIGTLIVYGLLQERIMQLPYNGELFQYSVFLVFSNRVAAVIFSLCMAYANGEQVRNAAPVWKYLVISLSNVYASTCQYEALKYLSFAVQMLGKSFKMLPVMVWGMAISQKRYAARDWCIAMAVTGGVTEFLMTGPTKSDRGTGNSWRGFLWLLAFLALDGLTSTVQEKLFKEYKTTKYNQMMWVNGLSSLTSLVTLITSGSLVPAFGFYFNHPSFMLDAAVFSTSAVASQFFIYSLVKDFGALVFAATMNVRQVVSIIISYVTYHHSITGLQILGLAAVFGALFYKSYAGLAAAAPKEPEREALARDPEKPEAGPTYKAVDAAEPIKPGAAERGLAAEKGA